MVPLGGSWPQVVIHSTYGNVEHGEAYLAEGKIEKLLIERSYQGAAMQALMYIQCSSYGVHASSVALVGTYGRRTMGDFPMMLD